MKRCVNSVNKAKTNSLFITEWKSNVDQWKSPGKFWLLYSCVSNEIDEIIPGQRNASVCVLAGTKGLIYAAVNLVM